MGERSSSQSEPENCRLLAGIWRRSSWFHDSYKSYIKTTYLLGGLAYLLGLVSVSLALLAAYFQPKCNDCCCKDAAWGLNLSAAICLTVGTGLWIFVRNCCLHGDYQRVASN